MPIGWSESDLDAIRTSGQINAAVHQVVRRSVKPGVTGKALNDIAEQEMKRLGAVPVFEEWTGFPGAICVSVNEEVGHGVPSSRCIREGDVVKVDIGLAYDGWHTDCARTYTVGEGSPVTERLLDVTKDALQAGVQAAMPGARTSDISHAIYQSVSSAGFELVRHAFGHGIGRSLHQEPQIANFGPRGKGVKLEEGMLLAIEPVVTAGLRFTRKLPDGWTDATVDGSLAAHEEDTVLITDKGAEVLTNLAQDEVRNHALGSHQQCDSTRTGMDNRVREVHHHALGRLTLRPRVDSDLETMIGLAHATMDGLLMEAWGRRVQTSDIAGDAASRAWIIEDSKGTAAGFLSYSIRDVFHVHQLIIAPKFQSSGIGLLVMREAEQLAKDCDVSVIELWVQSNNHRAIRFYDKLGFERTGSPYFNTLSMCKVLSD